MRHYKCYRCGETDLGKFSPSGLRKYVCKVCNAILARDWRLLNLEKHREYVRNWMASHPENNRKNFHNWYQGNKEKQYEHRINYVQENPERHRAQCYAFAKYPDAQTCCKIGCEELGERHHEDYTRPYDIIWLCRLHHKEVHKTRKLVVV